MAQILDGTYASLVDRVQPSGYAATSLTGTYDGMFERDASIQAMAMDATGDHARSRALLEYLIGYGTEADSDRAPRVLPGEAYQATGQFPATSGNPAVPVSSFEGMPTAMVKVNAPSNGGAQSFVGDGSALARVSLGLKSLQNGPGTITVSVRAVRDWSSPVLASATVDASTAYRADGQPVWVDFSFPDGPTLTAGQTYQVMVQASAEPTVVQWWGQIGTSERTGNYDHGWTETGGLCAFRVFTERGGVVGGQVQTEAQKALFQVQGAGHMAAQPFRLADDTLDSVWVPLSSTTDTGSVSVSVRTDHTNVASEVASGTVDLAGVGTHRTWVNIPLTGVRGVSVTPGAEYRLVINANVDDGQKVVWYGKDSVVGAVGAAFNFDSDLSGWQRTGQSLAFAVNAASVPQFGPGFVSATPKNVLGVAEGESVVTGAFSAGATLSGLDLFVAGKDVSEDVPVRVRDSTGREVSAVIPAAQVTEAGSWVRTTFTTVGRGGDGTYSVSVGAPAGAKVSLYGDSAGALGYQALALAYDGEVMTDQPDGNYMVIDSWARYVANHSDDKQFLADTYPTIARWADYYLTDAYLNNDLQLMFNPEFEHSRRSWHIATYDLITNVFAAQALQELAEIAADLPEQKVRAQAWEDRSAWLTEGINKNLTSTVTVEGVEKKIYSEMLWSDGGKNGKLTRYDGYSWVNLAPVAADWFATDWTLMANTYDAYLAHGSREWTNKTDNQTDLMLLMDTDENTWAPAGNGVNYWERYAVIGKGLGWEFALAKKLGRTDRLATLSHFVEVQTPGNVLGEFYYGQGPSDVGNQEQSSWWILGMISAFPVAVVDPTVSLSVSSVVAGAGLTVTGTGFAADTDVSLTLHSEPRLLATVHTDSTGSFTTPVTIPADTVARIHEIEASDGHRSARAALTVTTRPDNGNGTNNGNGTGSGPKGGATTPSNDQQLAVTGAYLPLPLISVGVLTALMGVFLLVRTRRAYAKN